MRVLFTIDSLLQGGTEESIVEIIRYFSQSTQVGVCYFYPKHDLLDSYSTLNAQVECFHLQGEYDFFSGVKKLSQFIKEWKPDVIVCSLYRASIISRLAGITTKVPVVGTFVEENYGRQRKASFRGWAQIKFYSTWLLDRLTAFIPFAWISNSHSIANANAKALGISLKNVQVIYRGRHVEKYPAFAPVQASEFRFAAIGRLFDKKGFSDLIAAVILIKKDFPAFRITIYGEGPYRQALERLIADGGLGDTIHLLGKTPDAAIQLYQHHCFVFPSWYEGFSGALVEAMMIGIPIISSDIPMNLEAVTHNVTARVFPVRDHTALAGEMQWVMNNYNEAVEMGQRARMEAMQRFDIKVIAKEYEETLRSVIEKIKR